VAAVCRSEDERARRRHTRALHRSHNVLSRLVPEAATVVGGQLPAFERVHEARQRRERRARRVGELRPELIALLIEHAAPHLKGQMAIMWSTGARVSSILYGCRVCDYLAAEGREQITFHDTKNGHPVNAAVHPWAAALMREYLAWRGHLEDRETALFLTDQREPLPIMGRRRAAR